VAAKALDPLTRRVSTALIESPEEGVMNPPTTSLDGECSQQKSMPSQPHISAHAQESDSRQKHETDPPKLALAPSTSAAPVHAPLHPLSGHASASKTCEPSFADPGAIEGCMDSSPQSTSPARQASGENRPPRTITSDAPPTADALSVNRVDPESQREEGAVGVTLHMENGEEVPTMKNEVVALVLEEVPELVDEEFSTDESIFTTFANHMKTLEINQHLLNAYLEVVVARHVETYGQVFTELEKFHHEKDSFIQALNALKASNMQLREQHKIVELREEELERAIRTQRTRLDEECRYETQRIWKKLTHDRGEQLILVALVAAAVHLFIHFVRSCVAWCADALKQRQAQRKKNQDSEEQSYQSDGRSSNYQQLPSFVVVDEDDPAISGKRYGSRSEEGGDHAPSTARRNRRRKHNDESKRPLSQRFRAEHKRRQRPAFSDEDDHYTSGHESEGEARGPPKLTQSSSAVPVQRARRPLPNQRMEGEKKAKSSSQSAPPSSQLKPPAMSCKERKRAKKASTWGSTLGNINKQSHISCLG